MTDHEAMVSEDDPRWGLTDRTIERPWLHELYGDLMYRWLTKNVLMRDDEHGVEIRYRGRTSDDVICGARTIRRGIVGFKQVYSWRVDQSVDHEVVCNMVGDHGEVPHVGVPAECADMTCQCSNYGSYHLVMVGFAIKSGPTTTWESRHA